MRPAAELLPEIVRKRADVKSCCRSYAYCDPSIPVVLDGEVMDGHPSHRRLHGCALAREPVCADAVNFLRRVRRRSLVERSAKTLERGLEIAGADSDRGGRHGLPSERIVRLGREAEADPRDLFLLAG